jgi:hypothetical protein
MTTIEKAWGAGLLAIAIWGCGGSDASGDAVHRDAGTQTDAARTDADGGAAWGTDAPSLYVGEVADSDVLVAVLADATRARLFFCGGETDVASDTHWFNLTRDASSDLVAQDGDFGLNAQLEPAAVSGEYRVADQRYAFSSHKLQDGDLAGLYEGTGECGRLGLIVAPGKDLRAQGACVGGEHTPEQVNPILPISLQDGRIRVQAPGQADSVLLAPAGL